MIPEPRNLDEAVVQARQALGELRAERAAVTARMSFAGSLAEEEALADEAHDLIRRERTILDALREARVSVDV